MGAAGEEGLKCHACRSCMPGRGARKRCPEEIRVLFETDNGIELEYDMMGTQG